MKQAGQEALLAAIMRFKLRSQPGAQTPDREGSAPLVTLPTFIINRSIIVLGIALLGSGLASTHARAHAEDVEVNTEDQMRGVAPRLEFEVGVNFLMAIGDPCRPVDDTESCRGGFPLAGGQVLALIRPWNRFAFGPVLAWDAKVTSQHLTVDSGERVSYGRHMWRLAVEGRWYSRRVAVGGLFLALQTGVAWMTDTLTPISNTSPTSATQTAPLFGFKVGGGFVPYHGFGATLAAEAIITLLPTTSPNLASGFGKAYAYGAFGFVGVSLNVAFGAEL